MARGKKRKSSHRAKTVKIGSRRYHCHAKRVNAFGKRKQVTRAYCKRVKKA